LNVLTCVMMLFLVVDYRREAQLLQRNSVSITHVCLYNLANWSCNSIHYTPQMSYD